MRRREITIPTLIGIFLTIGGLVAGLWLLREPLRALVGASVEETPQNVRLTNITDTSFVVSWTTVKATSGFVQYGEATSGDPDLVVSDDRDQERGEIGNYFTHLVTVRGLKPATAYVFRVGSGRSLYDQQGQFYQITSGPSLRNPPAADVAYGQINTASGEPAEGALVYITLPGIVPQAALVKSSGSWVVPLSTARTTDLTSYAAYDLQTSTLDIQVQAGSLGTASATTTTGQDSPVATITLGQVVDLAQTNNLAASTPSPTAAAPQGQLEDDTATTSGSKFSNFDLGSASEATAAGTLELLTPVSGERLNTTRPVIMGTAPKNAKVTIEINSEHTITAEVRADASGNFEYTVPQDLEPGTHTVTISAIVDGVVKKVTKSFVVEAAGESVVPAKSATPTATLKPTPKPTPTPLARVTMPSTQSGVPTSGNLTPTLVLLILGSALIFAGAFSYKKLI